MIKINNNKIYINNKEILLLSGEVHYYRLKKKDWQKTLDHLKECGCNCVATYIPWIIHEYEENNFDFNGFYHEENDLISFLDLVKENGLFLIARPGPFVMAEMKNEGIPYWVFDKDDSILPKTWDERITYNKTCDYSNHIFLNCVKHWYSHIIPILKDYEVSNGGNMVLLQLDNEVGMLSWVCNCPDLTDTVCSEFIQYIYEKYDEKTINYRYGNFQDFNLRSPSEEYALSYHEDLGHFMRIRTIRYFNKLKEFVNEYGVKDTPLAFNIHGSGGNRASNYPIGISQLYEVFKSNNNYIPGSDMYIGDVNIGNFQDLYLANLFAKSLSNSHQPLTAMEFEACGGDYSDNYDNLIAPQSFDIKTRLYIALGNKMLNLYLFSGGENYILDSNLHDGNNRIAITGQRHGYRAPIDYKGEKNVIYDSVKNTMNLLKENNHILSQAFPLYDNVVLGFIPDYYMTEFHYPNSTKQRKLHEEIKLVRDNGALNVIARSLILTNYSFDVISLNEENLNLSNKTLIVTSAKYMSEVLQNKIVNLIKANVNVLIYGYIPEFNMIGEKCTILKDFLNVEIIEDFRDLKYNVLSVYMDGRFANQYETRCGIGETLDIKNLNNAEIIMREVETKNCVGYLNNYNGTKVAVITNYYHCNLGVWQEIYDWLGIKRKIKYLPKFYGTYVNMMVNNNGEGYINLFNLDGYKKEEYLYLNDEKVFKNKIVLDNKKCALLPYNLSIYDNLKILKSSAEIIKIDEEKIIFRPIQYITEIVYMKDNELFDLEFNGDNDIVIRRF